MKKKIKPILVICGKSGSGKNYILEQIMLLEYTPGNTTRDPRENDPELQYWTKEYVKMNYDELIKLAPYIVNYSGNYYWTELSVFNNPEYDFTVVEPNGIKQLVKLQESIRPMQIVYVDCSLFKRIKNMRRRKDSWKKILERVLNDRKTFKGMKDYIKNLDNGIVMEV